MLDVEDAPSLRPITQDESMEDWVAEKLAEASLKHTTAFNTEGSLQHTTASSAEASPKNTTTSNDWADILCFYTASNGTAQTAPTRASPAPAANGKPISQEVPQSVSSTDPKVAAQQASDMRNIVRRKLTGYVGFANLPNQWHRKSVRKGFNFNVMVVGKLWLICCRFIHSAHKS
jgi:septin 7